MELITERYKNQVAGVLNCFDRIVLSGNLLQHCHPTGFQNYLRDQGIRCFDFQNTVGKRIANGLKKHVDELAAQTNTEIHYLGKSKIRKESFVQAIIDKRGEHPGLVCILKCIEGCNRFIPLYGACPHRC